MIPFRTVRRHSQLNLIHKFAILTIFAFLLAINLNTVSTSPLSTVQLKQRRAASVSNNELDIPPPPPSHLIGNQKKEEEADNHGWKQKNQDVVVQMCDSSNSNNSFIYCHGRFLEAAMAYYFPNFDDSKTIVDKPMKYDAKVVLEKFNKMFPPSSNESSSVADISPNDMTKFIEENFEQESTELRSCYLDDWMERPPELERIQDKTLKEWSMDLNKIWKALCRQMKPDVAAHPDRYSLLYVPKPFIIPGGRFREFYYWDAYWVIKGLLASGMHTTTKNMIENFVHMVEKYGFVPNGGRVYYLRRSQPPMLTAMVYEYYEATHDIEFIQKVLPTLEKELHFWDSKRVVKVWKNGTSHNLYQYRTESNVPRPESYREDMKLTKKLTKTAEKRQIWQDLASAAESGWDFSSRWMNDSMNLKTIQTTAIVPVDLNAYMCWNFNILSYLFGETDDVEKQQHYQHRHHTFISQFQRVFYVKNESGWYDFNLKTQRNNIDFFASVATPLFTRCYHSINLAQSENIFRRMDIMGVFNFSGGIPTSLNKESGQQWDYPNGWSPLNHMIIEGLRRSENPIMQQKAFWLAEKWVLSNYRVFVATRGKMWEKYNVIGTKPEAGVGGEYDVQSGFGWTNGVILDLLVTYSDRMHFVGLAEHPDEVADDVIGNPQPSTLPPRLQTALPEDQIGFQREKSQESVEVINLPPAVSGSEFLMKEQAFSRLNNQQSFPLPGRFLDDDAQGESVEGSTNHTLLNLQKDKKENVRYSESEMFVDDEEEAGSMETNRKKNGSDKANAKGNSANTLKVTTGALLVLFANIYANFLVDTRR